MKSKTMTTTDAQHPSSLLLPVLPELPPLGDPPVPVDQPASLQPASDSNAVRQESDGNK
jgi:hypothetical protein